MSTPTPWTQDGAYVVATVDGRQVDVADCARPLNSSIALGRENAALIVRAVNCHHELLNALAIQNEWVRAALECKDWHWDGDQRAAAEQSLAAGRAAIAKAECRS